MSYLSGAIQTPRPSESLPSGDDVIDRKDGGGCDTGSLHPSRHRLVYLLIDTSLYETE